MGNDKSKIKNIVYSAMAVALVTVATMIIRIPSPKMGYINFGDIMIFITAAILGEKIGFIAGGLGSAFADILGGYFIFAPATFIIKGIEGFIFAVLVKKDKEGRLKIQSIIFASILSALWMVLGYFIYEYLIFGIGTAYPNLPANLIQGGVSAAASIPILLAAEKSGIIFKLKINK
ncbi:MAG: ECF transporter S component [Caloramator sp.]|nr:ECF transporter S component [Caloramator sp.]